MTEERKKQAAETRRINDERRLKMSEERHVREERLCNALFELIEHEETSIADKAEFSKVIVKMCRY